MENKAHGKEDYQRRGDKKPELQCEFRGRIKGRGEAREGGMEVRRERGGGKDKGKGHGREGKTRERRHGRGG